MIQHEKSIGEQIVYDELKKLNIDFEEEKTFKGFTSPDGQSYTFDFYLPDVEVLIECQGHQHFKPASKLPKELSRFNRTVKRDELKKDWCKKKGYKLICIKSGKAAKVEIDLLFQYYPELFKIRKRTKLFRLLLRFLRKRFYSYMNVF